MNKVFLNGQIIDAQDAVVAANDAGLLYGAGLFETFRAINGAVFSVDDHLARLFRSAEKLMISIPLDSQQIKDAIYNLLDTNKLQDARIRLTITNGSAAAQNPSPTVYITASDLVSYPSEFYKKGVGVVLTNYRQNPSDPLAGHKTTSYFSRLMALEQARQKNAVESIWFTLDNRLAEGSISNIFLVKDKILLTPPENTPILPGIARKNILEIALQRKIEYIEKSLFISDVLEADEVFLTNVLMKVLPVISVEKHTVSNGKVGKITTELLECYNTVLKQAKR